MTQNFDFPNLKTQWQRQQKGCRRRVGCVIAAVIFLILALCGLLVFAVGSVQADEQPPLSVILIIDNSHSVFTEIDPDGSRFTAARLFLTALGLHKAANQHQAGLIFFGSQAETAVSLQPHLASATDTYDPLFSSATAMGWTNPVAALTLAREQLVQSEMITLGDEDSIADGRSAILLLTDGHPEWSDSPTAAETEAYMAALQAEGEQLAQANITLYTILLRDSGRESGRADTTMAQWLPIWQAVSRATPAGRLIQLEPSTLLPTLYHELLAMLTDQETNGAILQTTLVDMQPQRFTFSVPAHVATMTLIVQKSNPTQAVAIRPENGTPLTAVSPTVRYLGTPTSHEEYWQIETPTAGLWQIDVFGEGDVTIWESYEFMLAPTELPPTVTETPPPTETQTAVPEPTATAIAPTATAMPTAIATAPPIITTELAAPTAPPPVPIQPAPAPAASRWPWLLPLPVLLLAGGYLWQRHYASPAPIVTGSLHILAGPDAGQPQIELDRLKKTAVVIGAAPAVNAPADIPLLGATATLTIQPTTALNNMPTLRISGSDGVLLNGRLLSQPTQLNDSDQITIPPNHQLRYENLRLRATQRGWRVNSSQ